MKKRFFKVLRGVLILLPFLLGTAGFLLAGESAPDSAFISLCLYGLEYQDPTPNLLVELARWTAPLSTAGFVLLAFTTIRRRLGVWVRYHAGDSVAVYGPEESRAALLAQLGQRGIDGGDALVRAQSYILLGEEAENFRFYQRHRQALAGRTVYLQCQSLPAQSVCDPELRLFCPEETAARLFWRSYLRGSPEHPCLYDLSQAAGHRMKIVFLGFGLLGEEVLLRALQNNIFHPGQHLEYHIFGDGAHFTAVHRELASISDPVLFHTDCWYDQLPLLEEAHVVVVLSQEGQMALVRDLLAVTTRAHIDVFSAVSGLDLLDGRKRLGLFDWRAEAEKAEYILSDVLFERAKQINLRYSVCYGGTEDSEEAKEASWKKLDGFTRYSNVSSADYHEVRLLMLSKMGLNPQDPLPQDALELLSHLEHIRWSRYHYLNNWRYGKPPSGKSKDPVLRIHSDLVPYEALSPEERDKDTQLLLLVH